MNFNSEERHPGVGRHRTRPAPSRERGQPSAHVRGTARLGATTPKNLAIVCCGFVKLTHFLIDSASIRKGKIVSKRNDLCIILNRLTKLASCLKYVCANVVCHFHVGAALDRSIGKPQSAVEIPSL